MRTVWAFCICVTCVVAGITLPWSCWQLDRHTRQSNYRIGVVKREMAQVRSQIEAFKLKHGRYPTNDEGLSVLDDFAGRFRMPVPDYELTGHKMRLSEAVFNFMMDHDDKLPSSTTDVNSVFQNMLRGRVPSTPILEYDVAATADYRWVCVFNAAGLLDAGGVPYVYENRSGMDKAMFAHSLADTRGDKPWSIKVDRDIYVYSLAGFSIYEGYVTSRREVFLIVAVPVTLLIVFTILYRRARKRTADGSSPSAIIFNGLALSVLIGLFCAPAISCYVPSLRWGERGRASIQTRLDLLKKYHEKGVISDATFAKAKEAMEAELKNTRQ
jgi:hypothetical protein